MKHIIFITGATSGIGRASALLLAQKGHYLILLGRRIDRLEKVKNELNKLTEVHIICQDVSDLQQLQKAYAKLPDYFKPITVLINNAGLALGSKPIQENNPTDWHQMIQTNILGVLNTSHVIIPNMIKKAVGQIINIGSIASNEVYPNNAVYCATKHALKALTTGMRIDLLSSGIKVMLINPGLTETEFNLVRNGQDSMKAKELYSGYQPLSPSDIAESILHLITLPENVLVTEYTVLPKAQATATIVYKV